MTREQVKKLLPIIKAFSEGKTIEQKSAESWVEVDEDCNFYFPANTYRIKPESKYRPFKDADECWKEMLKHQPFGWMKSKEGEYYTFITTVDNNDEMSLSGDSCWSFRGIMNNYTFADGTPFGVKEEE